jgi:hypothetical protein
MQNYILCSCLFTEVGTAYWFKSQLIANAPDNFAKRQLAIISGASVLYNISNHQKSPVHTNMPNFSPTKRPIFPPAWPREKPA